MAAGQSRGLHQPRKISSGALLAKKETSYGTSKQLIGHSFLDKSYSRLLLVALRGQEKETRNVPIHQGSKNFRQPVQFAVPQTPIAWSWDYAAPLDLREQRLHLTFSFFVASKSAPRCCLLWCSPKRWNLLILVESTFKVFSLTGITTCRGYWTRPDGMWLCQLLTLISIMS